MLEAVPWENPTYGILGRAAGNVYYGGTAHPPATERAGPDKPPPTVARASALPDNRYRQAFFITPILFGAYIAVYPGG